MFKTSQQEFYDLVVDGFDQDKKRGTLSCEDHTGNARGKIAPKENIEEKMGNSMLYMNHFELL
jgi:hypothetical protein